VFFLAQIIARTFQNDFADYLGATADYETYLAAHLRDGLLEVVLKFIES
jgi:hypothetical protein